MNDKQLLLKHLKNAIEEFNDEVSHDFRGCVSIYALERNGDFLADVKSYGVNWSACGTQDPAVAAKMAEYIQRAVGICNGVNAILKGE